ncbi:hypothetical protein G4B88_016503 [Cannabis sativa]|uniref:Uncharacterized protein n=1 Tax=Cannabis sativa TaxID=3483 RepID=A0A7J6H7D4_CANSA|nr:hypothetical protein G4B88_016503 [Cannabis sativa]
MLSNDNKSPNHTTTPRYGFLMMRLRRVKNSGWLCHSVGSYKKKAMTAAAFSADGSVLDQVMIFHPSLNYVHLFWSPCWKGGLLLLLLPFGMFLLSCFELMVGHKNPSILHHNENSLAVAFSVSALAHQCLASLQRSYFDRLAHQGLALVLLRQPHSLFVLLLLSRPPSDILTDLRFQSHAVLALNQSVCHSCQESDDHAQGHSIGSPYPRLLLKV